MWQKFTQIWKIRDLRNSIFFVLAMLVVFRIAAHIPVPGVNIENLRAFFDSNQVLGLMNIFSSGGMQNFSIVMLGVAPYITSSIIFQLLGMIIPTIEQMMKEEAGRKKVNTWTRWATVPLALLQAYGMIKILSGSAQPIITDMSWISVVSILITVTAGTIFLMWLGELITERKIGNGVSLLIFAGIIASVPQALSGIFVNFDRQQLTTLILFAVVALLTIIGVVIISEGQRKIPVQYAKQVRGAKMYGGSTTHLPIKVNQAGVIPIIFAISILMFPTLIAQFMVQAKTEFIVNAGNAITSFFANQTIYGAMYFVLVFAFTYFYTAVIFHPKQVAENLQKNGGFIPGIRPGKHTEDYLQYTITRITATGALFLAVIAVLPLVLQQTTGLQSMAIGGTSILIVVSVAIETMKQVEAQMVMRDYEAF